MRKLLTVLVILLIFLGGIFVLADRLLVSGAEDQIGRQVAVKYKLRDQPEVEIRGFPFLTQAIGGTYDEIAVTAKELRRGNGVTIAELEAVLYGVHAPLSDLISGADAKVTADTVQGTVLVPSSVLEERFGGGVKVGQEAGDMVLTGQITVFGRKVPVKAKVGVKAAKGRIRVAPSDIEVAGGDIPANNAIRRRFTYDIPVRDLPLGLKLESVRVTSRGVAVTATAKNVPLQG